MSSQLEIYTYLRFLPCLHHQRMRSMLIKLLLVYFFFLPKLAMSSKPDEFSFTGFNRANLSLDGIAKITSDGLLEVTDSTMHTKGHAFYPTPLHFKSPAGKILSFSTTFVFAVLADSYTAGIGMAFVVAPTSNLSTALGTQYLGLFNSTNNGNSTNHIFAVELDTVPDPEFQNFNGNRVGIDINGLISEESHTAGYYEDTTGAFKNLSLVSGQPMQVWIDFRAADMQLNVTLSPVQMSKPKRPLLSSSSIDLASLMLDSMYVGFSASNGLFHSSHCVLGWSFKMNDTETDALDYAKLPSLPRTAESKSSSKILTIWLPVASSLFILLIVIAAAVVLMRRRGKKYAELFEDWELNYRPHRFTYKDLYHATKGFNDEALLGSGGFGSVYKGVLPSSKMEVAVKKVSHGSRQGMKEFVAEIVSIGQLRHRNLVQLLGYCRRDGELLLVYDFMLNGSLDMFLYDGVEPTLNWDQRFRIIKGVAAGLLYLHEDSEQVVIHRDIKASNVLLDREMNGRIGDFGLARLYDHGTDPQTTHVVGTMGYLAPELAKKGKATPKTDVFAFGAFILEVACGRRPIEPEAQGEELILVDWVLRCWQQGTMLETRDLRLGEEYRDYEVELVLKLGLLCSNPMPAARPSMLQIVLILEGDVPLPELPPSYMSLTTLALFQNEGLNGYVKSFS